MSTNINSTEQIVEINAGDQITNVNIVSQSTTQVISGEQVVTVDVNAGTIPAAWGSITGTLSNQTDLQNALNAKQNNITLTTTGTTGVATLVGATLNIPNYVTSTKQSQWDSAYNDKINSAEVSGTTTKTLTLTQQDGGIIQASWSDFDTAPVTSVFGRTGDVVATEGDYNINQLGDVTITSATNGQVLKYNGTAWVNAADASGLTSVGLAMPSAFTVSGSPLTSNGTITVTGAGTTSQYVRGDGSLAAFPSVSNEAKTLIREVYNKTGATLTKGTVIYIDGGQGNLPTVTKAIATGDPTSAQTFGIVQSDITNMNNGFVVVAGGIDNLDTQTYPEGTALYLSPTTAGAWTSTKPYAPDHMVYLGVVVRSHPTQGVIEVKIQNGVELDEIHNVSARFPVNKDGLFYNSTSGVWENKSIAGVLGYTPVPESRIITINGTAQNLSADRTWSVGTVTSVAASGGTGISVAGSPVTGSGTITITNTAPDQVVGLTGAGTTSISGTYPNFTITSNDQYTGTVTSIAASGGTGISIIGSPVTGSGTISITNTAPDQTVTITPSGLATVSGTYPNFTVGVSTAYSGSVTSVNASVPTGFEVSGVPITTAGTIDIKFASGYSLPTTAKQTQWDDAYTKRINSLTVTGNSGSSTLVSNVLNVPTYTLSGLGGEPAITAGTSLQYWRGDKTFQTLNTGVVPESGNVYFTEPRVRATVLSGLNITGGSISASDSVLDAFGKVQNQINGLIGGSIFQSTWNASTNNPTLTSSVGTKGYYYIVSVAGTTNLNGITDWQIGDWAIFDGTVWRKVDNTDAVVSVNGFTGTVSLGISNLADVSASSPTDTQLLRFNGTTSKWYNWTPTYISGNQTITLSGDVTGSGTTAITTSIGALKVTNAMLAGSINYAKMDAATVPTWNQDTTGNAATADKWKTARTLTIGATGKSVDGSGNVTWSASDIGLTDYLPLSGGTMTGQIILKEGTDSTDYTKGLRFPNDPYGGSGDWSGLRLYRSGVSGENMTLELYIGNDDGDTINFRTNVGSAVNNDLVTINGNKIWNSGNLPNPLTTAVTSLTGGTGVTVSASTGSVTVSIGQSVATSATPSFDQVITTNNGNGTNFRVGDDAWIGDLNVANTLRISGVQDATKGYISFGSTSNTALGRSGTGDLTWGGNTIYHSGNIPSYLPLSGGTLTGALIGTSATFSSGDVLIGTTTNASGKLQVAGSDDTIISQFRSAGGMIQIYPYYSTYDGAIIQSLNGTGVSYKKLRIECNAMTVTSSVTADSLLVNRTASRNMLGISTTELPTSGNEEGVAVIKTDSALWQLSVVGYLATGKGVRIYNNGGAGYTAFQVEQAGGTRFIVDGDGKIGVGIASPSSLLHVYSSANANVTQKLEHSSTYGSFHIINNASSTLYVGVNNSTGTLFGGTGGAYGGAISMDSAYALGFATSGSERMRITSGGDVFIGATSGSFDTGSGLRIDRSGQSTIRLVGQSSGGEWTMGSAGMQFDARVGYIRFITGANSGSAIERMRITDGGNIGIGETNPASYGLLTVNTGSSNNTVPIFTLGYGTTLSNLILRNTYARANGILNGIEFRDSSNEVQASIYANPTGANNQSNLIFGTNNGTGGNGLTGATERMRIGNSGNILIGYNQTTTTTIGRTFATNHASGNRGAILFYGISDGSDGGMYVYNVASSSAGYNSQYVTFGTHEGGVEAGERMRITTRGLVNINDTANTTYRLYVSGTVGASGGFFDTSDIRIKNIIERNPILDINVDLVKYTKNGDSKIRYGYIAQEVQAINSDVVEGADILSLNYSDIHCIKIAALENKIKELEAKLK